jgi:hypothetical protein
VRRAVAIAAAALLSASVAAAQSVVLDADQAGSLGARIIAAEGGPSRNPLSSAAGYGQFLSATWLEMFERAYPQVAQTMTRDQILALREIRPLAEDLTRRYAQANATTLERIGLPPTEGALSLAHAVGPGAAISVLTAEPTRPATELLSPEAIAANPFAKDLTAGALQRWATNRINPRAQPHPIEDPAPRIEPVLEPIAEAEDFTIDGSTKASQALVADRSTTTVLQNLLDTLSNEGGGKAVQLRPLTAGWLHSVGVDPDALRRGDPAAAHAFNKSASRIVLDAIRHLSGRPGFGEFKAIEAHAGTRGELSRAVVRALAIALLDKMGREITTIADIIQHRRSVAAAPPGAMHSAPPPLRNAANGRGGIVAEPPL